MVPDETICWFSRGLVVFSGVQCIGMYGLNRFKSYRSDHFKRQNSAENC